MAHQLPISDRKDSQPKPTSQPRYRIEAHRRVEIRHQVYQTQGPEKTKAFLGVRPTSLVTHDARCTRYNAISSIMLTRTTGHPRHYDSDSSDGTSPGPPVPDGSESLDQYATHELQTAICRPAYYPRRNFGTRPCFPISPDAFEQRLWRAHNTSSSWSTSATFILKSWLAAPKRSLSTHTPALTSGFPIHARTTKRLKAYAYASSQTTSS
jgi:hypothetical protein